VEDLSAPSAFFDMHIKRLLRHPSRNLQKLARHPSLLLCLLGGEEALARRHVMIELDAAETIYTQCAVGIKDRGLLDSHSVIAQIHSYFQKRNCYHNSFLYGVVRWFQPRVVIETGVHYGASSAFTLSALRCNDVGHLYSIDLPNQTYALDSKVIDRRTHSDLVPRGRNPGFAVPDHLRQRWSRVLEDVRDVLPRLAQTQCVDLFFHDSAHTYQIMKFECETVWPVITSGGILLSDDVDWSDGFQDFCTSRSLRYSILDERGCESKRLCIKA